MTHSKLITTAYRQLRNAANNVAKNEEKRFETIDPEHKAIRLLLHSLANYLEFGGAYIPQLIGCLDAFKAVLEKRLDK